MDSPLYGYPVYINALDCMRMNPVAKACILPSGLVQCGICKLKRREHPTLTCQRCSSSCLDTCLPYSAIIIAFSIYFAWLCICNNVCPVSVQMLPFKSSPDAHLLPKIHPGASLSLSLIDSTMYTYKSDSWSPVKFAPGTIQVRLDVCVHNNSLGGCDSKCTAR